MAKISIIVPIYNAEKNIEKCLNSINRQKTLESEIEIILINDGSKDKSDEIVKNYIKENMQDKNVKYFVKKNEGVAITRNYGIKKATGDYILFIDADDYISDDTIKTLEPYAQRGMDLIKFKLQRLDESGKIIERVDGPVFEETTGQEAFNQLYSTDVLLDSPCVYLIKKDLITKNNFEFKGTYHEDFGLIPVLLVSAKKVVSLPDYLYQYIQGQDSITRNDDYNKTITKMKDCFYHYDRMLNLIKNIKLDNKTKENIKIYYTNAILVKLSNLKKEDREKFILEIKKRRMEDNIKARDFKQLIKKIILKINIDLYLKLR